jgi:hypothetical protein
MITDWPAFWGFLGAVISSAPKLTSCLYSGSGRGHVIRCIGDAATALVVGTISAAAFTPWAQAYSHATAPQDTKAMAAVIGMLANSTAPGVIRFLSDNILTRIRGGK